MIKTTWAVAALLLGFGLAPASQAAERSFPRRSVTILVPSSAGSGADIVARMLAQRLAEAWGQGVVVENKDGASGTIGAATVALAPPDGHVLCMAFVNHTISPSLYSNIPYDILRAFKPVVRTARIPMAVIANPAFAPNTLPQLIAFTKARPANEPVFFGSPGTGSVNGLAMEFLKMKAGINLTQAPYKGNAQMITDVIGNQVPLGVAVVAAVLPQIRAGKLKALAVTSRSRSSSLPDVATVAEAGIDGYDISAWNGLLAPAGTPDAVVAEIHASVARIIQTPEFNEQLNKQGMDAALMNPQEFRAFLASEVEQWARVVKISGAKAD